MKNINKISIIIIILFVIGVIFSNNVQAIDNIFSDADEFLLKGDPVGSVINNGELKETSDFMYKLLMAIGIIVMFIVGTVIGIQYMVASAEDKAKVKEALVPYIVGCIVIFGAFTIWSIAVNIGQTGILPSTTYTSRIFCSECNEDVDEEDLPSFSTIGDCPNCGKEADILEEILCNNCGKSYIDFYTLAKPGRCSECRYLFSN